MTIYLNSHSGDQVRDMADCTGKRLPFVNDVLSYEIIPADMEYDQLYVRLIQDFLYIL